MTKIEASVIIDRPIEEVWNFINDLSKLSKWNPEVLEPKQTSAGPLGVGTTVDFGAKMGNSTTTISMRVTEYEPNRRFSFEHISGPLKGTTERDSLETIEAGKTRFTRTGDLKFRGFYKLVGPFIAPSMRRGVVASLNNLKRMLESENKTIEGLRAS
jgi:uncharacterized protein YndB with AHSA1/START domain